MLALLCCFAFAQQLDFSTSRTDGSMNFTYKWKDADGPHTVAFTLPTAAVEADNQVGTGFPKSKLVEAQLKAARSYAATLPKTTKVKLKSSGSGVSWSISAKSSDAARTASDGLTTTVEAAQEDWMEDNYYTYYKKDSVLPDHARLAVAYADDVAPLAAALKAGTTSEREFLARALSFVQTIPYEKRKRGGTAGYRRPLSVLARNKADCDGKSTLYLALVRTAYPELDSTIVYIPNHAFVGVATADEKEDKTFKVDGVKYVIAEPVGPALTVLGDASKRSKRKVTWGAYQARALE